MSSCSRRLKQMEVCEGGELGAKVPVSSLLEGFLGVRVFVSS